MARESSNIGQAFLSGQTIVLDNVQQSASSHAKLAELTGPMAAIHQPIVGAHGVMGVISVGFSGPLGDAKEHAIELVRLVAHEAAVALRRRESIHALERAALIDPLTSVSNRRAFDAELPTALRRAADTGQPLALVVIGPQPLQARQRRARPRGRDHLLIDCAAAWSDVLRAGDLIARLGGDEFAVLLPACDEIEMARVIERLRRATPHRPGTAIGGVVWDAPRERLAVRPPRRRRAVPRQGARAVSRPRRIRAAPSRRGRPVSTRASTSPRRGSASC
ncbi:MAG: diguanylate cyclase [Patulibacter minatonensis]